MDRVLQISPNDHAPFLAVCRNHARSLGMLGLDVETVFLESRLDTRADDCTYLDADALRRRANDHEVLLTHRYKGYLLGNEVRSAGSRHIAVAHEFGLFARAGRRFRQRFHNTDVVFAGVSQPVADDIAQSNRRAGRVEVLPNSVDVERLSTSTLSRLDARRRLNIVHDAFAIGVVGRLHPKKNPALALRGFELMRANLPVPATLIFVGTGDLAESLRAQAGDGVSFVGYQPDAATFMRAFDVLLVTSTDREAFGMTIIEAMVARTPVICADRPGPREVLGDEGCYFEGDDPGALARALVEFATDLQVRQARTDAAYQRVVDQFSVEALARRFERLLRGP
ncbi:MAG: glycosyltransferase family 4 protein [Gammaproteobacteria bacterium]|nr:glycosyltransferase family 4 protein [Gammaproteobacteria bacterium]